MRRVDCPLEGEAYAAAWLGLPDEWLGLHASRRDRAAKAAEEKGLPGTLASFAIALALLEDWSLPHLTGNPDRWELEQVPLALIAWVNQAVLADFSACFIVPKKRSAPSANGLTATTVAARADGDSTTMVG
jgi:hypothetical protein